MPRHRCLHAFDARIGDAAMQGEDLKVSLLQHDEPVGRPQRFQLAGRWIAVAVHRERRQRESEFLKAARGHVHVRHEPANVIEKDLARARRLRSLRRHVGFLRGPRCLRPVQDRPVARRFKTRAAGNSLRPSFRCVTLPQSIDSDRLDWRHVAWRNEKHIEVARMGRHAHEGMRRRQLNSFAARRHDRRRLPFAIFVKAGARNGDA